jgi:hypothetical protein
VLAKGQSGDGVVEEEQGASGARTTALRGSVSLVDAYA